MRMKFPAKSQLRTVEVGVIDRYVEWLFGPKVWGLATLDPITEKPDSTPTILHVMHYDREIRKKQAEFMNMGHDFKAALHAAMKEGETRQISFLAPISIAINTSGSKACTAPGLSEAYGIMPKRAIDNPRAIDNTVLSKGAIKKIKQQAKLAALKDGPAISKRAKKAAAKARTQLAIQNGGNGDGAAPPPTGGGARPAKGIGRGKDMFNGKPICYNWNRNAPCKQSPCNFAHVCLVCQANHRKCEGHPA